MRMTPGTVVSMEYEDPVQLADLLQRQTRRLRRAQAQRLAPLGLTPAQERALRIITRSEEPLRMTELADHLGIVPRSVIRSGSSLRVMMRRARSWAGVRPSGASRWAWARRSRLVCRWSRSASWTGSSYSMTSRYQEPGSY